MFCTLEKEFNVPAFGKMIITASNDLNEETIDALNKQVIKLPRTSLWHLCYLAHLCVLLWTTGLVFISNPSNMI